MVRIMKSSNSINSKIWCYKYSICSICIYSILQPILTLIICELEIVRCFLLLLLWFIVKVGVIRNTDPSSPRGWLRITIYGEDGSVIRITPTLAKNQSDNNTYTYIPWLPDHTTVVLKPNFYTYGNDFGISKLTRLHFKPVHPSFKWDLCSDRVKIG